VKVIASGAQWGAELFKAPGMPACVFWTTLTAKHFHPEQEQPLHLFGVIWGEG